MLRAAILLFTVTVAVLAFVALLPGREATVPDAGIVLDDVSLTLYPQADPEAVWHFATQDATYDPQARTSTLRRLEDGRRVVAGETDFTVASDLLTINSDDDIEGELIFAHLLDTGECLTMRGSAGAPVVIDQGSGVFEVPVLEIAGPSWGEGTRLERMRVSFDLEEFEAGGAGTTTTAVLRVGAADEETRRTLCDDSR